MPRPHRSRCAGYSSDKEERDGSFKKVAANAGILVLASIVTLCFCVPCGEANTALAGGHVDLNIVGVTPQVASLARSGKVRPLVVAAEERDPAFTDIPIPKDLGYSFAIISSMEGVVAPKNLPPDQLRRHLSRG